PGPCGAPSQTGGGAFGIVHVCESVPRQAGFPPIRTVVAHAPSNGDPCIVLSPSRAAGLGISAALACGIRICRRPQFNDALDSEQRATDDADRIPWVDQLDPVDPGEAILCIRHRALDQYRPATLVANLHAVAFVERGRAVRTAAHRLLRWFQSSAI